METQRTYKQKPCKAFNEINGIKECKEADWFKECLNAQKKPIKATLYLHHLSKQRDAKFINGLYSNLLMSQTLFVYSFSSIPGTTKPKELINSLTEQFKDKVNFCNSVDFIEVCDRIKNNKPDCVVIDCVQTTPFNTAQFNALTRGFPNKNFVFIHRSGKAKYINVTGTHSTKPLKINTDIRVNVYDTDPITYKLNATRSTIQTKSHQ